MSNATIDEVVFSRPTIETLLAACVGAIMYAGNPADPEPIVRDTLGAIFEENPLAFWHAVMDIIMDGDDYPDQPIPADYMAACADILTLGELLDTIGDDGDAIAICCTLWASDTEAFLFVVQNTVLAAV